MKRRWISILLAFSMVLALLPGYALPVLAAQGTLPATLSVEPTEANNLPAAIDLVLRDKDNNNGDYCLYLPGDTSAADCFFSWEGGLNGTVNSVSYGSGAMPIPAVGKTLTYTFSSGSSTKTFKVTTYQGAAAVPPIFIEIDESQGTIAAMNADPDHETECTGIIFIDGKEYELDKIKGRGNATWRYAKEKRPYNITLGSKVSSILGIEMPGKTKKFSLLANIADHSLLRNKIGYDMSYALDIGLDSASADVWMNGEYMGVYLVMAKNDSFITDDGYGLEDDNYTEPPIEQGGDPSFVVQGTVVPGGRQTRITVKKIGDNLLPDGESVASLKAATVPIQEYVQDVWDAIRSEDGYNDKGKYYAEYVDMRSWAAMYLMQEFVRGYDANAGSLLFHRDGTTDADKLFAGPMWDLDNALGSNQGGGAHGVTLADANGWFLRNIADSKGSIYQAIGKHEDFMDEVYRVYNENQAIFDEASTRVQELAKDLAASAEMNHIRITKETYNNARYGSQTVLARGTDYEQVYKATRTWQDYVDNLETFTSVRAHFFRDNLTREDLVYRGRFNSSMGSSVTAFDTRDTSGEGTPNAEFAFARNGETGELDSSGTGEINFRVDVKAGYKVADVTVVPAANYEEILSLGDGLYRITGITGTVIITAATEENGCDHTFDNYVCTICGAQAFRADIQKASNCGLKVYETRNYTGVVQLNPSSVLVRNGETGKADLSGNGEVNFMASVPEGYRVGRIKVEPEENYDKVLRPASTGVTNGYRITGIRGDISVSIETAKMGSGIDFTDPASEGSFEIVNQADSEIREGEGLYMVVTNDAFEPCVDRVSIFNPRDVVLVPVTGDWTATLSYTFNRNGSGGSYAYFGFYAMEDYDNCAGIRGGDSNLQDFLRVNGRITEETMNSSPGLSTSGDFWYRIEKVGTSYTCYRSNDGESFTKMFVLEDTGIEAVNLCIDAYTGSATGWSFLVKSLELESEGGEPLPPTTCTHDYVETVTPPTCTEAGFTTHTCSICGASHEDAVVSALGHSHAAVVTPPTCTEPGYTTYTCTRCSSSYTATQVAATGHSWDDGTITVQPTEDAAGVKTYTCTVCGTGSTVSLPPVGHRHDYKTVSSPASCTDSGFTMYYCMKCGDSYKDDYVSALGHEYKETLTEPTCTEPGFTTHTCTRCGSSYTNAQVAATGHSWDDGTVTTQPTEDAAGAKTYTCTICAETKTVSLPPIGHKHSYKATVTLPTCTTGGYTTHLCEKCGDTYRDAPVNALGHDYADVVTPPTCAASGFTTHTCTRCDESYIDSVTAKPGHSYKATVTPPTCTTAGFTTHVCERCGDSYVDAVVNALQHDYKATVTPPSCAAPGSTTYVCARCDHTYTDGEASTPEHDYRDIVTEPTCTSAGFTTHVCRDCGASYIDSWVSALDHAYTDVVTLPTCTSAGFTTHVCKKCAHSHVDSIVSALGHDYEDAVHAPTCLEPGITVHTCTVCEESYVSDEVASSGHKWDEGTITVQPTAEKAGEKRFTCTVCDETITVSLPPAGHTHSYSKAVTPPTCTASGYTTYTCTCGESYRDDVVSALGHDYASVVTAPGCLTSGYTTHTCTVCGESYRDAQTAATGHDWDEGKITTQPTEEKEGVRTFTCTLCGETRTETIPMLTPDHKHAYEQEITAPTCTTSGYTTYTCACGDSYTEDKTEALGHDYEAAVTEPTCEVGGYTTYTCSECGDSYVSDKTDPAGHAFEDGSCTVCGAKDETVHICPAKEFSDVDVSRWYHEAIDFVLAEGMMQGTGSGLFAPDAALSRAMLVQILYNIEGRPSYETELTFADVAEGAWYYDAVMWAAENGIVLGVGDGTSFAPDANVTREQMVTILYRYAESPAVTEAELTFADAAEVSDWALTAVAWAAENGVVQGVGANRFAPKDNTTRAATAQVCMNYFGK